MIHVVLRLVINALVIMIVAYYVPDFSVTNFWSALLFAGVLGIINAIIRPLILIFSLPLNILTLGLGTFVINAILFWVASQFVFGIKISSFAAAFWGALAVSVVSWLASFFIKK